MYSNYKAWSDAAYGRGLSIEHDGSGKIVAHLDGVEHGTWDPNYGGAGAGWFSKESH